MDTDTASAVDGGGGASRGAPPAPDGGLRALIQPALDPLFRSAERLGAPGGWWGHAPFAHWIVAATAPRAVVELGTRDGVSYSAFCQAAACGAAETRCFAVGAWPGEEAFEGFRAFHDARFGAFSALLRCAPDEALGRFAGASIDLMHFEGPQAHDAARRDFENWKPKLSERGVVLLHGVAARDGDSGLRRLWAELRRESPGFEFPHGRGLGVLAVGERPHPAVAGLCALEEPAAVAAVRQRFTALGERLRPAAREGTPAEAATGPTRADDAERRLRLETAMRLRAASRTVEARRDAAETRGRAERAEAAAHQAAADLAAQRAALLAQNASLQAALEERERLRAAEEGLRAAAERSRAAEEQRRAVQEHETERFRAAFEASEGEAERLRAALREAASERDRILNSTAWRATRPLRALGERVPMGLRRALRAGTGPGWWSAAVRRVRGRR